METDFKPHFYYQITERGRRCLEIFGELDGDLRATISTRSDVDYSRILPGYHGPKLEDKYDSLKIVNPPRKRLNSPLSPPPYLVGEMDSKV